MRRIIGLMDNWCFIDLNKESHNVDLPHTWNYRDGQDGGNDYKRGTCVYIKTFKKPIVNEEERVYIQFHGVNASARVLLNDCVVGIHDNGYSTFRFDITELLLEDNKLVVEVDNSVNEEVYPQVADFTFYGGIYRNVELLIVSQYHFDLDYYGGPGIQVSSTVEDDKAIVDVMTYVRCEGNVKIDIIDDRGIIVVSGEGTHVSMIIDNVHLWDGIEDPYLYTVRASLLVNGEIKDIINTKIGVRTFKFDPDKGFFLNGRSYPLHGVSRHQDRKGIGNAVSKNDHDEDMLLIREIGANTIRLAHYQHDQYFYDLCDKYGMVVWAEIPYISRHMPKARNNTFSQMKELIVQNYNHPSICVWGISNEITISHKHKKDMLDNHRALQELCHEMDSTRPTTLACYAMCHPFHPITKISDIIGWNLYLGWYVPGFFLNDLFMKFYHWIYPKRCLSYSEYGAEGMPNLHSSHPKRGDHSEEYQAKYHEYMLECFKRHPFLWGTYVWNMFDFAADARDQGGEPGMNHKGLVTFDRKVKKDSFYLYKAYWSDEPFVYIASKRYEYRTEMNTVITVYTNQNEVSLYNNGQFVACKNGKYVFKFKIKLENINNLEVIADKLKDTAVIYKIDKPRPEYKVAKGNSQNWV